MEVTTSSQERDFFDLHYSQFLKLPDHALRVDRKILESALDDPAHPSYERRRLLRAAMQALEAEPLTSRTVLDYGCGPGDVGIWLATEGAAVTLLDLSPAAIELVLKRARASGVDVRGIAADASRLDMLPDAVFDLVYASAALHHTMKYPGAIEELARIMKPRARLVLCETWGGNPILGQARKLTGPAVAGSRRAGRGDRDVVEGTAQTRSVFRRDPSGAAESAGHGQAPAARPLRNGCGAVLGSRLGSGGFHAAGDGPAAAQLVR